MKAGEHHDDHGAHGGEVKRYPVTTTDFSRVETPFIIGVWILFASVAKIGELHHTQIHCTKACDIKITSTFSSSSIFVIQTSTIDRRNCLMNKFIAFRKTIN
jgi:hypothetical protein